MQQRHGNAAVLRMLGRQSAAKESKKAEATSEESPASAAPIDTSGTIQVPPIGADPNFISEAEIGPEKVAFAVNSLSPVRRSEGVTEKGVEGNEELVDGVVEKSWWRPLSSAISVHRQNGGAAGAAAGGAAGAAAGGAAAAAPAKKKAGVDSFKVDWSKNASAGATNATLRLDATAKFKNDATYDPALAEYRQNVMTKWEITDGPHKGRSGDTSPMHDDNYSRADDLNGNAITDVDFYTNDNPGFGAAFGLDKNDVVDYAFTAEEMIIDTSDGNKVLSKVGPHTGTIKGKHPRTYGGLPWAGRP